MNATARQELERIAEAEGGRLVPEVVLGYAESPDNPLHEYLTWDDGAAAHEFRLEQVRRLIRKVTITVTRNDTPQQIRAFVSLRDDRRENAGYRITTQVMADADLRAKMLSEARADMQAFRTKYRALTELAPVLSAMASHLSEPSLVAGRSRRVAAM